MSEELDVNNMFQQAGAAMAASSPATEQVKALANEAKSLDQQITSLKALLDSATARFNVIKTKEMPDAMARLGSSIWRDPDDKTNSVEIVDFVSGSLPKPTDEDDYEGAARRAAAIDWLEQNEGESLIRTVVEFTFPKGEHNRALNLVGKLREEGFEPSVNSGVHPKTLQAFVRQRMKAGEPVDTERLGVFAGRVAKMKFGKSEKDIATHMGEQP